MSFVSVVTPAGAEVRVSCGAEGLEVKRLKGEISQLAGFPPETQHIHDRQRPSEISLLHNEEVVRAGAALDLVLPVAVVTMPLKLKKKRIGLLVVPNRIPSEGERRPQPAATLGASLVESLRIRAGLAVIVEERGYGDLGALVRACCTVRRCAMRRRATKCTSAMRLQATARQAAARLMWRQGTAARAMQAFARRCTLRIRWARECAASTLQEAARRAPPRHKYCFTIAARAIQASLRRLISEQTFGIQRFAASLLSSRGRGAFVRRQFVAVRAVVLDQAVQVIQAAARRRHLCSRLRIRVSSSRKIQAVCRRADRRSEWWLRRSGCVLVQALLKRALTPPLRSIRAVQEDVDEARSLRMEEGSRHRAASEALETLVGGQGLGEGLEALMGRFEALREARDCLHHLQGVLEGAQNAVRHAAIRPGAGQAVPAEEWQSVAGERDEARLRCIHAADAFSARLLDAQDVFDKVKERRDVAMEASSNEYIGILGSDPAFDNKDLTVLLLDAAHALTEWKAQYAVRREMLERDTESAEAAVFIALGSCIDFGAQLRRCRALAVLEQDWYVFQWWAECEQLCAPIANARSVYLLQLEDIRICVDDFASEKPHVDQLRADWQIAAHKPHIRLHAALQDAAQMLDDIEDEDRYDEASRRKDKLEKRVRRGLQLSEDEQTELALSIEVLAEKRKRVQRVRQEERRLFCELAVVCQRHYPEVPALYPEAELVQKLFQSEASKLFVPSRAFEEYTVHENKLSATPQSRHNVYRAEFDGQDCALKEYNLSDQYSTKQLDNELSILASLAHPCVLQVRCFFIENGTAYVELPFCTEGSLGMWLQSPRQAEDVFSALLHVLRAVEWLHHKEIVHCDIRKENVLVDQREGKYYFYLSDFDVADSKARSSTRGTMTSLGARGFDSQLTMAPELRTGSSCSFASDMFSFGGLVFTGMFRDYCLLLGNGLVPTTPSGEIQIPAAVPSSGGSAYDDAELRDMLGSLLHPDSTQRMSASQSLSHPFFAASGGKARAEALERLEELSDQKRQLEEQEMAAEEQRREEGRRLKEQKKVLDKKRQTNVQHERQLRDERASVEKSLRDLAAQKHAAEQAAKKKKAELDEKEREVKSAQQKLLKRTLLPKSWSHERPSSGLRMFHITDRGLLATLEDFLTGKGVGNPARDRKEDGRYNALKLERAWRVENDELWRTYVAARSRVRRVLTNAGKKLQFPSLSLALDGSSKQLPDGVEVDLNEKRLVHGTDPPVVASLLRNGMNERFAGQKGTRFGAGNYLAEDAAKSDQYCTADCTYQSNNPLHQMLYGASHPHPGEGVFYILICRVVLGFALCGESNCFNPNASSRELRDIPGVFPPTPHHSLIAQANYAYKEIILFHGDQVYPEYLLAYRRTRS